MGKLSRLRLRQQSNGKKREEGVGAAELAVLTGGAADRTGKNGGTLADGNGIPRAPAVSRGKRKSGK